jgi:ABC-2 type transport system permease protein
MSAPMAAQAEPERARPRSETRPPSGGWRIVAAKELADHLGSTRFVVLFVVLGLAGASAVYSVSQQITSVASGVGTTQSLFPLLFTLSASDIAAATQQSANTPLPSFVALISLLAPLLGIAFGFDAVNRERSDRTLPRLLAQPIYRDDVINGKFAAGLAAIGIALGSVLLIIAAWGVIQLGVVPTAEDVARLAVWYVVAIVYIGFWLALATLCSVVMRRAASSALVAISAWLVVSLFGGLLISTVVGLLSPLSSTPTTADVIANGHLQDALTRISPDGMFQIATQAILDPHVTAGILTIDQRVAVAQQGAPGSILSLDQSLLVVGPQVLAIVALSVVCFALAYIAFMRQEVRA